MEFVVIDLYSQLDAVNAHIKGWDRQRILMWLRLFGEVSGPFQLGMAETLVFRSVCARTTGFYFNEQNEILIPGRKKRVSE